MAGTTSKSTPALSKSRPVTGARVLDGLHGIEGPEIVDIVKWAANKPPRPYRSPTDEAATTTSPSFSSKSTTPETSQRSTAPIVGGRRSIQWASGMNRSLTVVETAFNDRQFVVHDAPANARRVPGPSDATVRRRMQLSPLKNRLAQLLKGVVDALQSWANSRAICKALTSSTFVVPWGTSISTRTAPRPDCPAAQERDLHAGIARLQACRHGLLAPGEYLAW